MTVRELDKYQLNDLKDALFAADFWKCNGLDEDAWYDALTDADKRAIHNCAFAAEIPDEIVFRAYADTNFVNEDFTSDERRHEMTAESRRKEILDALEELIKNNSNIEAENDDTKALDGIDYIANSGKAVYLKFLDDYGTEYKITVEIN